MSFMWIYLKQYVTNPEHVLDIDWNHSCESGEIPLKTEEILESQEKYLRHQTTRRVLVEWNEYPIEDASWED